ncbi:MAG: anaerobic ribonucleoside-triphosphate reductase activating protein [Clostridiales bacterium]|nr:anaerobic ribonucleoside-triphosphate reductase activating protein [Clostridiales bacterium]
MNIAGIQKLTLLDYPGLVACTVFTGGCNFRCPFCHNAELVVRSPTQAQLTEKNFWDFLESRRGLLDGVVISGGEPLLQDELAPFLYKVKEKGLRVKLDTNGSLPERLRALMEKGLLDCIAMDIKNSPQKYVRTAGTAVDLEAIGSSIALLLEEKIPYEFRTTAVRELHEAEDFAEIGKWIRGARQYYIQCFRDSGNLLSDGLSAPSHEALEAFLAAARASVPQAELRGVS